MGLRSQPSLALMLCRFKICIALADEFYGVIKGLARFRLRE
jgi:hypothetical protein